MNRHDRAVKVRKILIEMHESAHPCFEPLTLKFAVSDLRWISQRIFSRAEEERLDDLCAKHENDMTAADARFLEEIAARVKRTCSADASALQ
jgi:hypothetical protein